MISPETRLQIRRYFYAEHWKIGTIAQNLGVHPDTVRRAIEVERFPHAEPLRPSIVDPYLPLVREVLGQHPRLRATRLYQMIRDRGYSGSVEQLRRVVARLICRARSRAARCSKTRPLMLNARRTGISSRASPAASSATCSPAARWAKAP